MADKTFLGTIGDRSVGGLISRDPMVGPWQVPVRAYLARRLAGVPGVTLEALRAGPVRVGGGLDVAFADGVFPTPSGRVELRSDEARRRWDLDELPVYTEPVESVRRAAAGRRAYPLSLLTPNTKNRIHSQFGNLPSIRALDPGPVLALHPSDAAGRGIRHGTRVRVFNDRGSLEVPCRFDLRLRPGCVALHNGWWLQDGGAVNVLSKARETDMGHGLSAVPCEGRGADHPPGRGRSVPEGMRGSVSQSTRLCGSCVPGAQPTCAAASRQARPLGLRSLRDSRQSRRAAHLQERASCAFQAGCSLPSHHPGDWRFSTKTAVRSTVVVAVEPGG